MHFAFITRGIKDAVDKLIHDLQAQYFHYQIKKTKKKVFYQLAVRPIQLWEVVCMEEDMPMVIKTIAPNCFHPRLMKWVGMLRRFIGFEKMPEIDKKQMRRIVINKDVEIIPVGVKKDAFDKWGDELL